MQAAQLHASGSAALVLVSAIALGAAQARALPLDSPVTYPVISVTVPGGADASDHLHHVTAPSGGAGIDLSWDDCGTAGVQDKPFSCTTNAGSPFTMIGSFSPPPGVNEFLGMTAAMTIVSSTPVLPDWWKHGTSECRGLTGLSSSFDFTAGPFTCLDFYYGQAAGGFSYEVGYGGSDRARLRVQCAVPIDNRGPVTPGSEYFAFKINIHRAKTMGSGNCAGCSTPVSVTLDSIQLFQPAEAAYDPTLTQPLHRNFVTWQSGQLSPSAPEITSFTPHQGGDGTPVTLYGHNFVGTTAVRFGNLNATFGVAADSIIETIAPNGVYTSRISVTTPEGTAASDTLFQVGPPTGSGAGINLSWDDCGRAGNLTQSSACNLNTGPPFAMMTSFRPPAGINQFFGLAGDLDLRSSTPTLPEWWKIGSGQCRGATALHSSADFTAGPFSCLDFWGVHASGGVTYDVGFKSPDRARLRVLYTVPFANRGPLDPLSEYYAFKILVAKSKSTGTGSCAGCSVPVCIVLNQIQLFQSPGIDDVITNPLDRSFVTWQSSVIDNCPASTAVQVSVVSAKAVAAGIELVWMTHEVDAATLYRREGSGAWLAIAHLEPDGPRRIRYDDHDVVRGATYAYRLGIRVPQGEVFQGEVEVHVPLAAAFALHGVRWARAGRELIVSVSLPSAGAAMLEIYDVNSRRLLAQRLENIAAGPHEVRMTSTPLRSGVFFARLTQRAQRVTRRFVMVE